MSIGKRIDAKIPVNIILFKSSFSLDDADALISLVHRIIMEKLDAQLLADLCKNCEDVFSILDKISKEVKLAMDFMFDVERMRDINLMEITRDR